ncbi:MAG: cyclic nucleotide-binding domain-containing protein [Candidatus Hinthialibacter antarcticus]|nr:cyclic nucleotide-binding domain-containing protein [Candidatus Hinthialibacter antarcticus]
MPDMGFGDLSRDVVRAGKGTVLMRQGELGKCAYFVVEGRLMVETEISGQSTVIAEIGARDLVGELAILDDAPRSATVIVAEDSLLIPLNKHRLRTIIRRSPNIAELILKLLCHKLRNTHKLITHQIDLNNAHIWMKVGPLLSLCAKASSDPSERFNIMTEQLKSVLETPDNITVEILQRLAKVHLIKLASGEIQSINEEHIEPILNQLREEFLNEPFGEPTLAKEFQAIQVILNNCIPNPPSAPRMDIPRQNLVALLMHSNLWMKLHPSMQQQRAEMMVQTLDETGMVEQKPQDSETLILDLEMLRQFPRPDKDLAIYDFVRKTLLCI